MTFHAICSETLALGMIGLVGIFAAQLASAGDLRIGKCTDQDGQCFVRYSGRIDFGDVKRFAELAKQKEIAQRLSLILDSEGGDVESAIAIGRIVRNLKASVGVHASGKCYSSCIFVLAGGVVRWAGKESGPVGIHRPYLAETRKSYDETQRAHAVLELAAKAYLREMNVPDRLYDDMLRIPADRVRILTDKELEGYGLSGSDPVYADWVIGERAKQRGITKEEFLRRRALAESKCASLLRGIFDSNEGFARWAKCDEEVFAGGR